MAAPPWPWPALAWPSRLARLPATDALPAACWLALLLLLLLMLPQFMDVAGGVQEKVSEMTLWDASQHAINAFNSVAGAPRPPAAGCWPCSCWDHLEATRSPGGPHFLLAGLLSRTGSCSPPTSASN